MRARRLLVTLVASTLSWGGLTAAVGTPDAAAAAHASAKPKKHKHKQHQQHRRDTPHDPATYYSGTEGLTGNALALALNAIIDGNTFVPYTSSGTDVWKALKVLDRDPNNPSMIIDFYNGDDLDPANQCGSSCALNGWNREHTWAQSRGSFDTSPGPGTDLHHMRPLRGNTNSSRGNKDFDNGGTANVPGCPTCKADGDSFEPGANKGDLARGLFYMDVRYNGDADDGYGLDLRLWDQVGNSGTQIGKLSTLVAWALADPPDAADRNRNDLIDGDYQHNRNPFIDHPEWVCAIWGAQVPASCSNQQSLQPTPSISGTPKPGVASTGVPGTWDAGTTQTYKWYADGVVIPGATATTYTPTNAQNGQVLTFEVTSTRPGYATVTKTSAGKTIIGTLANQTAPSISGTPAVGSELTADPGGWTPSGITFAYQWYANGVAIPGATGQKYTPVAAQNGKLLAVGVTASRPGFDPVSTSSPSVRVTTAPISSSSPPVISGTASVGQTLSLSTGTWNYGDLTFTYQWFANGAAIRGASQSTYVISPTMSGKVITGRVTASRPGNDAVVAASSNSVTPG